MNHSSAMRCLTNPCALRLGLTAAAALATGKTSNKGDLHGSHKH